MRFQIHLFGVEFDRLKSIYAECICNDKRMLSGQVDIPGRVALAAKNFKSRAMLCALQVVCCYSEFV